MPTSFSVNIHAGFHKLNELLCYYNLVFFLPKRLNGGSFLDLADKIGYEFSYKIISVKHILKFPLHCSPATLMKCVVYSQYTEFYDTSVCAESPKGINFYTRVGMNYLVQMKQNHVPLL